MVKATSRQSRQSYVWVVSTVLAGLAVLASVLAGRWTPPHVPVHIPWPAIALAFAAADIAMVHFDFRDQGYSLNLQEVPLAVGLVFCSPHGLLAARLVGTALSMGVKGRQPPIKLCFNLAQQALRVAVAEVIAYPLLAGHPAVSAQGWLGLLAAGAAAQLIGDVSILAVIWITAGRPQASMLGELLVAGPALLVASMTLGLICVSVLWVNEWAAWMLMLVAGIAAVVHQLHHRLRRRYSNLERLYGFTGEVAAVRPSTELSERILAQARAILRAERATLLMADGDRFERTVLDSDGLAVERGAQAGLLEAMVIWSQKATAAPRHASGSVADALAADGWRDALLAPVAGDDGIAGVLAVSDRLGSDMATFDEAELMLFEALAQAAGVALRRGQLVEELKAEVAAKEYQAYHDSLTGLPNRTFFSARLADVTARRRPGTRVGVLLMDLDEFKDINDTLGHDVGDAVLTQIGLRLADVVGSTGLVTRMGGDEFAVLMPAEPEGGFEALAERVRAAAEEPICIQEVVLRARASLGLVICPDHGEKPSVLLQRADVAMYAAKSEQRGLVEYRPEQDQHSARRLALVGDLRQALSGGGEQSGTLELFYQPKAELATGKITGVEALLRWKHPVHGMVPPDEFIPLAEHSGVIGTLTSWVLDQALSQQAQWASRGIELSMAVNISVRSLLSPELVDEVSSRLAAHGVPASRLTLEITESSVMADPVRSIAVLRQLSDLGLRLSVDDFGTGYSSLSRLTKMPVDEVKIDKSLVFNMLTDGGDLAIVRTTIDLARNLDLLVVAEGIEDELTWQRLLQLGCQCAQGYHLTRPLPAPGFEEWLEAWNGRDQVPAKVVAIRSS